MDGFRKLITRFRRRELVWDVFRTSLWGIFSKAFGFLVPFFIAAWFGVSAQTDALFFTYGLILYVTLVFAPGVENLIVPYINELKTSQGDIGRFVSEIIFISGAAMAILVAVLMIIVQSVLPMLTRFNPSSLNLVRIMLLEMSPLVVLMVWTSVLAGSLNAFKKFNVPLMSLIFRALCNILLIFAFKGVAGVHAIIIGYVGGEVVRVLFLYATIRRLRLFRLRFIPRVEKNVGSFIKKISPQIVGMTATGFTPIINNTMASWLGAGSVSVLNYADRLYSIPVTFLTVGLTVPLLAHWSERFFQHGLTRLKRDVLKTLKPVVLISAAVMLLLIVFHRPIVKLAFGRGQFDAGKLIDVGQVWIFYLIGLVPYIVGIIVTEAHMVLRNTHILMFSAFVCIAANFLLNLILIKHLGIKGIALAVSITYLITTVFQSVLLYREKSRIPQPAGTLSSSS